jgi:hypothetical protein
LDGFELVDINSRSGEFGLRKSGKDNGAFSILVIGAGKVGAKVLLQLKKNPKIEVKTVDPREVPYAVEEGIIDSVDYIAELTPIELKPFIERISPDIVLVTTSKEDISRNNIPGLEILVDSLRQELELTADVPIITVNRDTLI